MAKGRRSTNASQKLQKAAIRHKSVPPIKIPSWWSQFFSGTRLLWGIFVAVLTIVPVVYQFGAKVKVTYPPHLAIDPSEILHVPFSISNEGVLDVMDLKASCSFNPLIYTNPIVVDRTISERPQDVAEVLHSDEKRAFMCYTPFDYPVRRADITIMTSFRSSFWPWKLSTVTTFKTHSNKDGSLRWEDLPLGE